jgi:hypothetical protein
MAPQRQITIKVVTADALRYKADVLALKYAQRLHGVDEAVYERLKLERPGAPLPNQAGHTFHDAPKSIAVRKILFVGVQPISQFGYAEIREFGRIVLVSLATELPETYHLALTIHGARYGLDEIEAFKSELAGVVEAITAGDFPEKLGVISFVEQDSARANRLSSALKRLVPKGCLTVDGRGSPRDLEDKAQSALRSAGYGSATKPRVFVAMPFMPEMDDVFHFGIQGAVNGAGLLCERADLSTFTGDVMDWVKSRISTANLVVADLTSANPNVYLEIGYAWARNVPTVLVVKDGTVPEFNVKGQRYIIYKSIKHLQDTLAHELKGLIGSGSQGGAV